MLTLFCVVVGEGRPFPVTIAASATVGHLKDSIKAEKGYQFAADAMDLYKAYKNGGWLDADSAKAMTLGDCDSDLPVMKPTFSINAPTLFGSNFQRKEREVHVLVQLPQGGGVTSAARCPRVSVLELLRSNPLPVHLEFVQAMEEPVGFKIPVNTLNVVSNWPDVFCFGEADYGSAIDSFIEHCCVGSGKPAVTSLDACWLRLFQDACKCTIYLDDRDASSSCGQTRPDVVIVNKDVVVGMCQTTASEQELTAAALQLTNNLAEGAFRSFPHGRTAIPSWTTCATRIELRQLAYSSTTKSYATSPFKTYFVTNKTECVRFIVDVFKIMRWAFAVQQPNALMGLVPGVRTATPNGHYITWVKAGLVKELREDAAEIDMALIQRIYDTDLCHVERGWCSGKTVTITSVCLALKRARFEAHVPRAVILAHVRAALDELHSIGVAHCDVRADNVFVLVDERVILGDLEYCRPVDAAPPRVKCIPTDKPCKTALALDEYQYRKFQDELAEMGID